MFYKAPENTIKGEHFHAGPACGGDIRVILHQPLEGTYHSAQILRDTNQWYVHLIREVDTQPPPPAPASGRREQSKEGPPLTQGDRIAVVRVRYPNAYKPWTAEDDRLLLAKYQEGVSPNELVALLGRQPSAVRARLDKLLGIPSKGTDTI